MKKHMGFIMVGMLALAALGFTACGEEGEFLVFFENYSNYDIIVNCTKATPSRIELKGVASNAAPSKGEVTFYNSNIRGHIIWTAQGTNQTHQDDLIKCTVQGLKVVFTNID